MKSIPAPSSLALWLLLLTSGLWLSACREIPDETEALASETPASAATEGRAAAEDDSAPVGSSEVTASPSEEVSELRREIQSQKQTVEDLQAAVDMEHAKLEENPDYDQSFLLEVQDEQEQLRSTIETDEARLQELTRPGG